MGHIDYYFSTISPYTYLAGDRLEQIAAKHGVDIAYKPVDLMALFARTGGVALGDRHPSRQEYRAQDLERRAKLAGMAFNLWPAHFPTNMAPSSYAIIAAQKAGGRGSGRAGARGVAGVLGRGKGHRAGRCDPGVPVSCGVRSGAGR